MDTRILLVGPRHDWHDEIVAFLGTHDIDVRVVDVAGRSAGALAERIALRLLTDTPAMVLICDGLLMDNPMHLNGSGLLAAMRNGGDVGGDVRRDARGHAGAHLGGYAGGSARGSVNGADVPVIMLGADADAMEKIICLELGADDYLDLPCNYRELLSRIRNVLRHRPAVPQNPVDRSGHCIFGDFALDVKSGTLTQHGVDVTIQGSTRALLQRLAEHPMKVLSRQNLIGMLAGHSADNGGAYGTATCERSLDVVVCRLRRIIEADPARPKFIQTVRGFGYVFNPLGAMGLSDMSFDQSHRPATVPHIDTASIAQASARALRATSRPVHPSRSSVSAM